VNGVRCAGRSRRRASVVRRKYSSATGPQWSRIPSRSSTEEMCDRWIVGNTVRTAFPS
jgi:hypothetical protein